MASSRAGKESLLSDTKQVFPVSVHASGGGNGDRTIPDETGNMGGRMGYSLREDRKRSFAEFDGAESDHYPYSEEEGAGVSPAPECSTRAVPSLLDFSVLSEERPAKPRVRNWTHPETKTLLAIWGDPEVQVHLKSAVHNNWIWERISVLLGRRHGEFQPPRTAAQCKERLTYLRKQYRKTARLRARGKWPNVGNIQIYLDEIHTILGKRTPASARSTAPSSAAPSTTSRATTSDPTFQPSSTAHQTPAAPPQQIPAPSLPEVPESDYEENEDEEDGDLEETEENDIRDLFAQNQTQGQEMNYSAGMSENNDPTYDPTAATNSAKPSKRVASSHNQQQHNSKKSRGRPKSGAPPPRDDLTVAQAITDAVMRFIDHQSHHLTEQTKLLQRYLKFERARMRWEMDMETRRMKWEEEREMREEERRQRQEELQAKRVSDNREFMLQMAVVLGNEAATGTSQDRDSTEN
ncbi:uncharacterized protein LOC119730414 isoform X1 [Patiria miniata]|uniref:Myb/SANT-like DNA-binding domain-containing protein n=1 Tax=Patiria miniata TaxID=46514 RepID=A0A914A648_PATMI|nr:uncharacterized protein LOC119730414 isoform X1 [Patiria miniata]